MQVGAEKPFKK